MKHSPCRDCNDRHTECHSKCERYIKWKNERDELQTKIRKARESDRIFKEHCAAVSCRLKRKGK